MTGSALSSHMSWSSHVFCRPGVLPYWCLEVEAESQSPAPAQISNKLHSLIEMDPCVPAFSTSYVGDIVEKRRNYNPLSLHTHSKWFPDIISLILTNPL